MKRITAHGLPDKPKPALAGSEVPVEPPHQSSGKGVPSLTYLPALDGVRGVAIFLVLIHHVGLRRWEGGFLGVDIFFVLSGFLITSLLVQECHRAGLVNLKRFYLE